MKNNYRPINHPIRATSRRDSNKSSREPYYKPPTRAPGVAVRYPSGRRALKSIRRSGALQLPSQRRRVLAAAPPASPEIVTEGTAFSPHRSFPIRFALPLIEPQCVFPESRLLIPPGKFRSLITPSFLRLGFQAPPRTPPRSTALIPFASKSYFLL